MAQYEVHDPEELLECPYDKVHMVRAKRFQYHLMKCRKNYTGKDFATCPFNAKHEMPRPELRHHYAQCPDRAMIDPELEFLSRQGKQNSGQMLKGCTDTPVYNDVKIESTEDWDAEVAEDNYVPFRNEDYVKFRRTNQSSNVYTQIQNRAPAEEAMRLPKTTSLAARSHVPPRQQPDSSVFSYSVSVGRGRGRGMAKPTNDENAAPFPMSVGAPMMPVGRGMSRGFGRGSTLAQPPGFCVPNINSESWN